MSKEKENLFPVKLAKPAQRALEVAGIRVLKDLTKWTEKDFSNLHGIGPNAIESIKTAMKKQELKFRS